MVTPTSWAAQSMRTISARVSRGDATVVNAAAYPQDDAWLGMAISTSVGAPMASPPPPPLYLMHAGSVAYAEGYVDRAYPLHSTTLIWHNGHPLNKYDASHPNASGLAERIVALDHLLLNKTRGRCYTPNTTLNCAPIFRSCAGAEWRRCLVVHVRSALSSCEARRALARPIPSAG